MMRTSAQRVALILLMLLGGCISVEQPNYFALNATAAPISSDYHGSIGLRPVRIPEYLQRTRIVRTENNNTVDLSSDERWAEPLEDSIRRVMTLNLANLLPTDNIRSYPWSSKNSPDAVIALHVLELTAKTGKVQIVVDVELTGAVASNRLVRIDGELPPSATGADIAAGYSELLAKLSETIAREIRLGADLRDISGD